MAGSLLSPQAPGPTAFIPVRGRRIDVATHHAAPGSAVEDDGWVAWVREENWGPDGSFCAAEFHPAAISSISKWAWAPSKTTLQACSKGIDKTEDWHDDLYGWFYCRGTRFQAGTLHRTLEFVEEVHWRVRGQVHEQVDLLRGVVKWKTS